MKEFITEALVEMHRNCTTDKYGQVHRSNFTPSLFGDKKEEVEQYCKETKDILQFATYGASYGGTYRAFTVENVEIRKACQKALSSNKNFIRNMTSW